MQHGQQIMEDGETLNNGGVKHTLKTNAKGITVFLNRNS